MEKIIGCVMNGASALFFLFLPNANQNRDNHPDHRDDNTNDYLVCGIEATALAAIIARTTRRRC
jgi:hypothetical protein